MKILLIRPVTPPALALNITPPLGLGYLASSLRNHGHEPMLIDSIRLGLDHDSLQNRIEEAASGIAAFSVYSCDVPSVREDMRRLKKKLPGAVAIAGGPHVSGCPETFFSDFPDADYGICGEAERSLPALIDFLETGDDSSAIPGLIFRSGEKTIVNKPEAIEDLGALPLPAWDLIDPRTYPESPQGIFFKRLPIAPIITTRGCPMPCTFCSGRAVHGMKIRRRPLGDIIAELDLLQNNFGIRELHILDDNFTHDKRFAAAFCETLLEKNIDVAFCFPNGVRLDTLDEELLRLMKRAGCYSISVGIESGSQKILDAMRKGLKKELIEEKVRLIKKCGLTASGFFILGFPGETEQTAMETIRFARKLPLDRASFFNFLPLPGTAATKALIESGELDAPDPAALYYTFTPYISPGLSEDILKRIQRKAFLGFFLRPRIILGLLASVRSVKQLGFILKRMSSYMK